MAIGIVDGITASLYGSNLLAKIVKRVAFALAASASAFMVSRVISSGIPVALFVFSMASFIKAISSGFVTIFKGEMASKISCSWGVEGWGSVGAGGWVSGVGVGSATGSGAAAGGWVSGVPAGSGVVVGAVAEVGSVVAVFFPFFRVKS